MINFFLHTKSLDVNCVDIFIVGMNVMVAIEKDKKDESEIYMIHNNFWNLPIINQFYEFQGETQAIYKFLGTTSSEPEDCSTDSHIDAMYPGNKNAFLGINFISTEGISSDRQITNVYKANLFRNSVFRDIDCNNLWDKISELYPHFIFCDSVQEQIMSYTNKILFAKIIYNLAFLENLMKERKGELVTCGILKRDSALKMSPDTDSTLKKYGEERKFKLPNGEKPIFSYHLKIDDQRIYILEVSGQSKLYIGYIGKHLRTVKCN